MKNLSESDIQKLIKIEASNKGARLWRNNVGAVIASNGQFFRFGLANESNKMNKIIKSSDLIGIRPIKITPEMVGGLIGQFLCREVKHPNWKYTGTEREQAQLKWLELIASLGGDACFAVGQGTI